MSSDEIEKNTEKIFLLKLSSRLSELRDVLTEESLALQDLIFENDNANRYEAKNYLKDLEIKKGRF